MCRGERQTLEGKSPKLSRISYTSSSKLDELPTDLDTKVLGSIRIKKGIMRSHYRPDRFKSLRQLSNQFRIIEKIMRAHLSLHEGNHQKGIPTGRSLASVNCFGDRVSQCVAIHGLREHRRSWNHVVNPF